MNFKRRGFTLISMLIVIAIITILAAMLFMSSTEAISTARAAAIIANLNTLKKAATQWYIDNRDKVQPDGRVKIGDTIKPVQEWTDEELNLSSYLSGTGASNIQFTSRAGSGTYKNPGTAITEMQKGDYGLYDGGTVKVDGSVTEFHRNVWYVGYRFTDSEAKVREKIKGRMESAGVFLATSDVHKDTVNDGNAAVWMKVF